MEGVGTELGYSGFLATLNEKTTPSQARTQTLPQGSRNRGSDMPTNYDRLLYFGYASIYAGVGTASYFRDT